MTDRLGFGRGCSAATFVVCVLCTVLIGSYQLTAALLQYYLLLCAAAVYLYMCLSTNASWNVQFQTKISLCRCCV